MSPFWTAFWILFIYVPLIVTWVFGLADVFRRSDLSGPAQGLWVLAIVLLPFLGLLIYFVARPGAPEYGGSYYGHGSASGPTVGEELQLLAGLHDRDKLTDEEYLEEKRRVLLAP